MESYSRIFVLLLIYMLSISSATDPILQPDCDYCYTPHTHKPKKQPIVESPPTLPPMRKLPVPRVIMPTVPQLPVPPATVPKVLVPPARAPKLPVPPVMVPPVLDPPKRKVPCPPPAAAKATCPIDTLKLGACVDLLGGLVHIGLGDPAGNECCPIIYGLVELKAMACLCTTLKIKALNLNIYVPLALQLLVTCGKTPPPGYTCSL